MSTRLHSNLLKAAFLLILFLVLIFRSIGLQAQAVRIPGEVYKGFVAALGTRITSVSSSIQEINQSQLQMAGGEIGLVYGNQFVRGRMNLLGYYSSVGRTSGTTDLYTSSASVNLYPLSLLSEESPLIAPYITGGLYYDQYKFFGFYANQEPGTINYSQGEAPYLGKITQANVSLGAGLELTLKDEFDFIHIFSEIRYGKELSSQTNADAFSNTALRSRAHLTLGFTFGMHR